MARIRSIHPGLFTDEAFASLGSDAQMFLIGLWTEADDQGMFEWKPVTLRMRLRPTKDGSVDGLLADLCAVHCIKRFDINGRPYGAIRNFRKFQRPKKPNAIHPMTDEVRTYVGLSAVSSELEADEEEEVLTKGEIAPQMEDVGCRVEEVEEKQPDPAARRYPEDFESFLKAYSPPKNYKKPDTLKAWNQTAGSRPPQADLLRAVAGYNEWLAAETRRRKSDYPKQLPATWLRGEVWNGFLDAAPDISPERLAELIDKTDRKLGRGKYDPMREILQ